MSEVAGGGDWMIWPILIVGFAAGFIAAALWQPVPRLARWFAPKQAKAAPATATPLHAPVVTEALSTRLHRLANGMENFGDASAHPRELADHDEFKEAVKLLEQGDVPAGTLRDYALGANWTLSCAAFQAMASRVDCAPFVNDVLGAFNKLRPWSLHFAFLYLLSLKQRPAVGATAVMAIEWWAENLIIPGLFRDYFTQSEKLGDKADFGTALSRVHPSAIPWIDALLAKIDHSFANTLRFKLASHRGRQVDSGYLNAFGRFWEKQPEGDVIVESDLWSGSLDALENTLDQSTPRSVLVTGEPRVGKTALLRLLGARLMDKGWRVFEASASDLMSGQKYIGEIEERVRRTVEELSAGKRVAWYVPSLMQFARSGTHQGQAASILDQIMPALSSGRLVVLTEATPAAATRLLQALPKLRSSMEIVRLDAHNEAETADLAEKFLTQLCDELSIAFDPECVPSSLHLARQYLGTGQLPGTVLDLLKITAGRVDSEGGKMMKPEDMIETLSQVTGLPASILDNREKIDLGKVRTFFSARVIGQDDAVRAMVDRIAMLKAGVTDPGRPIGVFLFAGPTGTGKTELAKTLAEYLFGTAERLIRLDMSEFQTADSTHKILGDSGGADTADSLIQRVRKQPFSVVLLDEFEKAHSNIWDLFLQVFDDGRLSDAAGQVADFRHCIIILTSNLGATAHRSMGLGFNAKQESFSSDYVIKAIGTTFRPEFINRLDSVIVFRQLSRDLMRGILQKELARVLERRGLKARDWAVEWEGSALEFLLEKGFSAEMGARPLKRAIDQFVLAPLAATIVEHRFPEGDQFLFMRSDGHAIQAEFVDPDADEHASEARVASVGDQPSLAAMMMQAEGIERERGALDAGCAEIRGIVSGAEWEALKSQLAEEMGKADFWSQPERHKTLARFALMDRIKAAMHTADALRDRLVKSKSAGGYSRELVTRLAQQVHVIREGIRDALDDAPVEAVLQIEPALDAGSAGEPLRKWCEQVREMYRSWAAARGMQISAVAAKGGDGAPVMVISGFGAYRALAQETGLHVLEGEDGGPARVAARVRVAPAPLGDSSGIVTYVQASAALDKAARSGVITRRYKAGASPLVRDAKGGWRSGKIESVLAGNFDLIGSV